ncbi:MAG TPA: GWxTD domain-containing protein [Thermoanaerobaculia bacterium]|nr:GWxTD domain-containing protein [Thermoanaerobaculia bacterium]
MKLRNTFGAFAIVAIVSTDLSAAVSPDLQEWAKGPVQFLMTTEELQSWKGLNSDAEAQAFINLFWARRDPTPSTPANEYKAEFDMKVTVADERFSAGKIKGSLTDRAKYLYLLGAPSRYRKRNDRRPMNADSETVTLDPDGRPTQAALSTETWFYDQGKVPKFALSSRPFEIAFIDQFRNGLYKLGRINSANAIDLAKKAVLAAIVSPSLTQAPTYAAKGTVAPVITRPAVPAAPTTTAPATSFKNSAFAQTVADVKAGKTGAYKPLYSTYGEGVTTTGEYYVPLQLFVPKAHGVTADSNATFFGTIEDSNGQVVALYEEPAKLTASKEDYFYDRSIVLPSGNYKGFFGLAIDGKPVMVTSNKMELKSLDKDLPGSSKMILSNNIYPLTTAQMPTDPFSFGGIKVVPKGDKTFLNSDELWYFIELRNAGLDDTGKTRMQVIVEVDRTVNKKKVTMRSPPLDVPAEPLRGVDKHYALGNSIPLAGFAPGDYVIRVKVIDTVSKQNYNFTEDFKVIGAKKG